MSISAAAKRITSRLEEQSRTMVMPQKLLIDQRISHRKNEMMLIAANKLMVRGRTHAFYHDALQRCVLSFTSSSI